MAAKILKTPFVILLSILSGVFFGLYAKKYALTLGPIGDAYSGFFRMSVIPILVTAIVSSLAQLMKDKSAKRYTTRIILIFLAMLALTAVFGTALGLTARPGADPGETTTNTLNEIIKTSSQVMDQEMALKIRLSIGLPGKRPCSTFSCVSFPRISSPPSVPGGYWKSSSSASCSASPSVSYRMTLPRSC